jgi:hypothetical protein
MHGLIPEPFTISVLEAVVEDMTGTSIPHLIPGHKKKERKTEKDPADSKRLAATQVARPFLAVVLQRSICILATEKTFTISMISTHRTFASQ